VFYYVQQEEKREFLKVVFFDVGQGDSIWIEAPNGNHLLIDGGPSAATVRHISHQLPFYDRHLSMILATHHDLDHTGGFPEILKRYRVDKYGTPLTGDNSGLYFEIEKTIKSQKNEKFILKAGDRIFLDKKENIYIDILWPPEGQEFEDKNDASVITKITYKNTSFLLTGDAPQEVEEKVVNVFKYGGVKKGDEKLLIDFIQSQVLKAGHHGSKTSSSEKFVKAINPEFVVISAGLDNKFGHPHEEVVNLLKDLGIKKLETFASSSITFFSDGEKVWLE